MNHPITPNTPISDELQNILSQAAAFEGDFKIDWLIELSNRKPSLVLDALEDGVNSNLLLKKVHSVFAFNNEESRQQYLNDLNAEDQAWIRKRIIALFRKEFPSGEQRTIELAKQYSHISNDVEGCRVLAAAADLYYKKAKPRNALAYYNKLLEDLLKLSGEDVDALFVETVIKITRVPYGHNNIGQTIRLIKIALNKAETMKQQSNQALLEIHLAAYEWFRSCLDVSEYHFRRGVSLIDDHSATQRLINAKINFNTVLLYAKGFFRQAVKNYEIAQPDVEKVIPFGFPLLAAETIGCSYVNIGETAVGFSMLETVRQRYLERGNKYLSAQASYSLGIAMLNSHRIDEAIGYLDEVHRVNEGDNHILLTYVAVNIASAWAYFLKGDHEKAEYYFRKYLRISEQSGVITDHCGYLMKLLWAVEERKLEIETGVSFEKEIQKNLHQRNVFLRGLALRYDALFHQKRRQSPNRILKSLCDSQKWLDISGHKIETARTQLELIRCYSADGNDEKVSELKRDIAEELSLVNMDFVPPDLKFLLKRDPKREDLLEEILKLGQEFITMRGHRDLIQRILAAASNITGAERSAIFLIENHDDQTVLKVRASKNITEKEIQHHNFSVSMAVMMDLIRKVKKRSDLKTAPEDMIILDGDRKQFKIYLPMIVGSKIVGVLYLENRILGNTMKEMDLKILLYYASQIAIALENVNAYMEIERLNEELREETYFYKEEHLREMHFGEFVGAGPAIKRVFEQINSVAGKETNVLILGETGVGKELVARAIHNRSIRSHKPFVPVHCSALPESLISGELFGHEKGAFTGATSRRIGRFEMANTGTIFLDEIGELSLDVQVRLLRVLQTKEFERIGGSITIRSDFRLIAATNRNLEKEVADGRFRSDLYYRLNVFPIYVPPLRERVEDIPLLTDHFLKIYGAKLGRPDLRISRSERKKFMNYYWPGNVRELSNVVERGIILSSGSHFISPEIDIANETDIMASSQDTSLRENERRHIMNVLRETNWRVSGTDGAAALLNIKPTTLYSRMKKLGIERPKQALTSDPE